MQISINQNLPNSTFYQMTDSGVQALKLADLARGKNILLIGMPGAFTKTCDSFHLPSLVTNCSAIFKKGIDEILCVVVNDVHVAKAWGDVSGATQAGIKILADVESQFAKSIGLDFSVPKIGFFNRLQRVAIIAQDNSIVHLQLEPNRSNCSLTSGDYLLSILSEVLKD